MCISNFSVNNTPIGRSQPTLVQQKMQQSIKDQS
jgi:hypothetical protein